MISENDLSHQQHPIQQSPLVLLVAGVLIVLMAGTGGYLLGISTIQRTPQYTQRVSLQPSPTVTLQTSISAPLPSSTQAIAPMNWRTYTNETLGISFNYPNNWKSKSYLSDKKLGQSYHQVIDLSPSSYTEDDYAIKLLYYENPENLSLDELNKKLTGNSGIGPGLSTEGAKPVKMIGRITAYYYKEYFCEPSICEAYIWSAKGRVYQFIYYPSNSTSGPSHQNLIFHKIFYSLQSK